MRKLLATLAIAGVAAGISTAAIANPVDTPVGSLTVDTTNGSAEADGASTNPDPFDGSIYVDGSGICAGDEGNHASRTAAGTETCNEDLIPA